MTWATFLTNVDCLHCLPSLSVVDLVRGTCLEIEPYIFEPVCQSGESESNDSHADTDSDSDTDGDMYRGLAHQPVQLWCECRLGIPAWLRSVMSPSSGTSRVAL